MSTAVAPAAVAETHSAVVFFVGDRAYKLKKLRCSAPPDVAARRIRRRAAVGGDPSDATPEIAAKLAAAEDPWAAAAMVDTSSGPAEALVKTLALIGRSSG